MNLKEAHERAEWSVGLYEGSYEQIDAHRKQSGGDSQKEVCGVENLVEYKTRAGLAK